MGFIEEVKKIIEPKLRDLGYELFELSYLKDGPTMSLRVRVDKPGARIGLDQIVSVSEALSAVLDDANLIETNYILDVSSAGAEHAINVSELAKYVGAHVNLHLREPIKGLNTYEGDIVVLKGNLLTLSYRDKTRTLLIDLPIDDIDHARLAVKF